MMLYYRFKVGMFVFLSVVFWAVMLYFLTATVSVYQTQLALDQMKSSDEAAEKLRVASTSVSWGWFAAYVAASLCYWWSDICRGIGNLVNVARE